MYIDPLDMMFDFQFWRPAMHMLAHHACQAIRLAGDPVTRPNFQAFIGSLPLTPDERDGEPWRTTYCFRCLLKLDEKFGAHWGTHDDCISGRLCPGGSPATCAILCRGEASVQATNYFRVYFPNLPTPAKGMLLDAIHGILDGTDGPADDPPSPPFSPSWRDGCRTFAARASAALRLAGKPVERNTMAAFLDSLPLYKEDLSSAAWQRTYCARCLLKLHEQAARDDPAAQCLAYFLDYFPCRGYAPKSMLLDSFLGLLTGANFDRTAPCAVQEASPS